MPLCMQMQATQVIVSELGTWKYYLKRVEKGKDY